MAYLDMISIAVLACETELHAHFISSEYALIIIPLISNAIIRTLMNRLKKIGDKTDP